MLGAPVYVVFGYGILEVAVYFLLLTIVYKDEKEHFDPWFQFIFSIASLLISICWINNEHTACYWIVVLACILVSITFLLDRAYCFFRWIAHGAYRLKQIISDITGY